MRKYNPIVYVMIGISIALLLTAAVRAISYHTGADPFSSKKAAYSVMDSNAESVIPVNKDIHTDVGRSPVVIVSVIIIIVMLSGTVYIAQVEQERK